MLSIPVVNVINIDLYMNYPTIKYMQITLKDMDTNIM